MLHSTTGVSPAELMFGRLLRTHLDLLHPNVKAQVSHSQHKQKQLHDAHCRQRQFKEGESVFTKKFSGKEEWVPGIISKVQGPVSFLVSMDDGRVVRRHADHVKSRETMPEQSPEPVEPETVNNEEANTEVKQQRPVRIHNPPSRLIEELDNKNRACWHMIFA